MESLFQIRENFISECSKLLKVARVYDKFANMIPDFRSHPDKLTFIPNMADLIATYDEMAKMPDMTERVIQAQMIGEWRLFLTRVFEWHIYQVLQRGASYKIKVKLPLEFPVDLRVDLVDSIQAKAVQEFDRQDYDNQLDTVIRLLGKPINKDDENIQFIKKHKVIRDVIQHNRGKLRKRDFEYLGVSEFSLSKSPVEGETIYKVEETVVITYWEIDQLCKNLWEAAKSLIPDQV